jgi:hypothetical protein
VRASDGLCFVLCAALTANAEAQTGTESEAQRALARETNTNSESITRSMAEEYDYGWTERMARELEARLASEAQEAELREGWFRFNAEWGSLRNDEPVEPLPPAPFDSLSMSPRDRLFSYRRARAEDAHLEGRLHPWPFCAERIARGASACGPRARCSSTTRTCAAS